MNSVAELKNLAFADYKFTPIHGYGGPRKVY
jgi:hypothetical protein